MKSEQIGAFYPLSKSVRSLFHKLGAAADALHEGSGISTGMRAVLENVVERGPMTVPEMARIRPVSRQHIQALVNDLLALGLVDYQDNPAHRRSKLVRATKKGHEGFSALKRREFSALKRLASEISPDALQQADRVLTELISAFDSAQWHAITKEFSPKR
jgi:DNA-binding MarR family transcriptional regulator